MTTQDTFGTVFKNGGAILLARVVDAAGDPITPSDVASIHYDVLEINDCAPDSGSAVVGHENAALSAGTVVFDTLQTDGLWTIDGVGYNFRHEIDVATAEAFPKAGTSYQVRYEVAPLAGQKMVFRFHLRAI